MAADRFLNVVESLLVEESSGGQPGMRSEAHQQVQEVLLRLQIGDEAYEAKRAEADRATWGLTPEDIAGMRAAMEAGGR